MPENVLRYSAWVGGVILAKVVFPQNQHITKADYDEIGPSIYIMYPSFKGK
ncbi:Actin-related protein 7 [Orobanche minor]